MGFCDCQHTEKGGISQAEGLIYFHWKTLLFIFNCVNQITWPLLLKKVGEVHPLYIPRNKDRGFISSSNNRPDGLTGGQVGSLLLLGQ